MVNKQKIFNEFDKHLMEDNAPSAYFEELIRNGSYPDEYPFKMLTDLIDTPQSSEHHPEGNTQLK